MERAVCRSDATPPPTLTPTNTPFYTATATRTAAPTLAPSATPTVPNIASGVITALAYDLSGRIARRFILGYSNYVYEAGSDWPVPSPRLRLSIAL